MTESVVGVLSVEITADADGLKKGLKASQEALKMGGKELRRNLNEWGKWAATATAATGGVAAALVKSNLSNIRELKNLSFAANTTVADFQTMAFAASQYGIEQEKLGDILKDFNDRVGDFTATGAGPMVDFFEQIGPKVGVTIDDFQKLSGPEGLQLYVSSLEKANLSQQDMTFFMEAIASDSTRLLPLLQSNGKAMSEQAKAARELGIGLSEIDVQKAEDAQKQLDAIGAFLSNELMVASAELAPLITEISKGFIDAAKESGGFARQAMDAFENVGKFVAVFADGVHGIEIAFKSVEVVVDGFVFAMAAAFNGLFTILNELKNSIVRSLIQPFKSALEALAPFSDTAKEALNTVNAISNRLQTEVPQGIRDFRDAQKEALLESRQELHDLAMEQLPSQQFDEWLENVRSKIKQTTEQLQADIEQGQTQTGTPTEELSEPARLEQETIGILEALNMRFMSVEEAQLAAFEREKQLLDEQHRNKELSEEEHSKRMAEIKRQEEETKRQITVQNVQDGFNILAQGNKKFQKLIQDAATVQAVIKGKESAVSAWSAGMAAGGPLLAAAYATASIAKTKSMIDSIRAGGKSQGGISGSATVPTVPTQPVTQATQSVPETRNININLAGEGLLSTNQVRELINQINEQTGDGVQLNVGA